MRIDRAKGYLFSAVMSVAVAAGCADGRAAAEPIDLSGEEAREVGVNRQALTDDELTLFRRSRGAPTG